MVDALKSWAMDNAGILQMWAAGRGLRGQHWAAKINLGRVQKKDAVAISSSDPYYLISYFT